MKSSDLAKLAATFAAGGITAQAIEEAHGHDVLGAVLGLATGGIVGVVAAPIISTVMDELGVSDLIDDLF